MAKRFVQWLPASWIGVALILGACAGLTALDPPRVTLAGVESVEFQGMELRMLVQLRVQNPNGLAIDYDGIDVSLALQGKSVARGVSGERGTVPRYGEAVIALPVTISLMDLGRQALRIMQGDTQRLRYTIEGKLGSPLLGATRFHSEGELQLPLPASRQPEDALARPDKNPL